MDLKAARCPSCGGNPDIPQGVDFSECPYCGIDINLKAAENGKIRDTQTNNIETKKFNLRPGCVMFSDNCSGYCICNMVNIKSILIIKYN
jgi:hypothetical protein